MLCASIIWKCVWTVWQNGCALQAAPNSLDNFNVRATSRLEPTIRRTKPIVVDPIHFRAAASDRADRRKLMNCRKIGEPLVPLTCTTSLLNARCKVSAGRGPGARCADDNSVAEFYKFNIQATITSITITRATDRPRLLELRVCPAGLRFVVQHIIKTKQKKWKIETTRRKATER